MKHLVSRQRRLRPQPPSSWPTAHDWLFQGDIHTRDENDADATPPGLISSDQMADIAGIWKKLDADGSGSLSLEELDKALKLLGYENDEDTAELVRLIDKDGSGVIEWEEFRTLMVTKVVEESNEVEMDLTFEMLDLNGDGDISGDELKALLMHRGQALSAAEADDLVSLLSGGSGVVSYETFREGMSALFRATPSTSLENRHADTPQRKARFSRPTNANGASYNSLPGGGGPQQPPSPISESNSLPPPSPAHAAAVSGSMCHSAAASENTASFSEGAVVVDRQRSRSLEERQPELPGACGPPPAFGGVFGGIHLPGAARRASSHAEQTTESPVKSISPSEGGSTSNTPPRRESRLRPSDADDDVP